GGDREDDRLLRPPAVVRVREPGQELRIVLYHARAAPELDAPALGPVDQEHECAVVLRQVAEGDVLPVPAEVREGECLVVQHAQKAGWTDAVLYVGLAVCPRGREEEAVACRDERRELRSDPRVEPAARLELRVRGARALAQLDLLHGLAEDVGLTHGATVMS